MLCSNQIQSRTCFQLLTLSVLLAPAMALAGKGHKAHEHGTAQVNVVGDANTVVVSLESPSEGIYGFEHEAKKTEDIKKRDDAIEKLKANADKMFVLDAALACKLTSTDIKPFVTEPEPKPAEASKSSKKHNHKKGTHSEVHATFKFECSKPVAGTRMGFAVTPVFKSLKKIKVQVLSGNTQSGTTIKNDSGSISL